MRTDVLTNLPGWLLSLMAGLMLSTSLLHAMPAALASQAPPAAIFATLLGGLLSFFLLERAAIMCGADAGHSVTDSVMIAALCVGGGVFGYQMLDMVRGLLPYALTFASAGFLYVAVSLLMPHLQKETTPRSTLSELAGMAAGILIFAV